MAWKDYLWICLISVGYRLLIIQHLFKAKYSFLGTIIPYPLQPDAFFYYAVNLPKWLIFILPLIFLCVGLCYFYKVVKKIGVPQRICFFSTICLSFFTSFFIQTYASYTDTTSIIFMCTCALTYYVSLLLEKKYLSFIGLALFSTILYFGWTAHNLIYFSIIFSLIPLIIMRFKNRLLVIGILVVTGFILIYPTIYNKLLSYTKLTNNINELQPMNVFIYYVLFILFVCLILRAFKERKPFLLYLYANGLFFGILGILMRRWGYLGVLFMLPCVIYCLKDKYLRLLILLIFLIGSIISNGVVISNAEPLMDNDFEAFLYTLDKKLIVGNWGSGHVYNLFTKGEVLYKANPKDGFTEKWNRILTKDFNLIYELNKSKEFYVILNEKDLKKLNTEISGFDILYNKKWVVLSNRV